MSAQKPERVVHKGPVAYGEPTEPGTCPLCGERPGTVCVRNVVAVPEGQVPHPRPDVWICAPCAEVFTREAAAAQSPGRGPTRSRLRRVARYSLATLGVVLLIVLLALLAFRIAASLRESSRRADVAPRGGRFVRAGDVDVFVQEMGPADGPAVVLVHGTGAWGAIWHPTMRALADAGFRSVAIDMPPFGFSERPAGATSYSDNAQGRRIVGVVDALKLSRVTLIGHSFGARATMAACFTLRDRVRSLVLVDAALGLGAATPPSRPSPVLRALLSAGPLRDALVASTFTNPLLTRRLLAQLIRDPADATDAAVAMLQQPFSVKGSTAALGEWLVPFLLDDGGASSSADRALYESLATPTLVLWGEDDMITPLAQGKDLARLIPGARLVVLPRTGHIPAIEDATRFNHALVAFLSEQRTP